MQRKSISKRKYICYKAKQLYSPANQRAYLTYIILADARWLSEAAITTSVRNL